MGRQQIFKISVSITGLTKREEITLDLFDPRDERSVTKSTDLSRSLDALNKRYGKQTVTMGAPAKTISDVGTKIAFSRIPDIEEFSE